jgi:Dolichyl-phosphate-mannose-protein mannosyltransferase
VNHKLAWILCSVLLLLVLLLNIFVAFVPANSLMNWFSSDDTFYYFKVAQNIVAGKGVTFDGINPTNGFHPLWMLVCIVVFAIFNSNLILPLRALVVVSAVMSAASTYLVYRVCRKYLSDGVALLAATCWAFLIPIHSAVVENGLETGLNALMTLLLINLVIDWDIARKEGKDKPAQLWWVGVAAATVVLSRLDNVFLVGMVGLFVAFRKERLPLWLWLDELAVAASALLSFILMQGLTRDMRYTAGAYGVLAVALVVKPCVFALFGFYKRGQHFDFGGLLWKVISAVVTATVALVAVVLVLSKVNVVQVFPRSGLLIDLCLSLIFIFITQTVHVLWSQKNEVDAHPWSFNEWIQSNWREWWRSGYKFFLPVVIALLAFMVWSYVNFQTAFPVSGTVKRWWGTLPATVYKSKVDTLTFLGIAPGGNVDPWALAFAPLKNAAVTVENFLPGKEEDPYLPMMLTEIFLLSVAAGVILYSDRKFSSQALSGFLLAPLYLGCFLQILFYGASGYQNERPWYWVSEMIVIVLFGAVFVECLYHLIKKLNIPNWVLNSVIGILCLFVVVQFSAYIVQSFPLHVDAAHQEAYLDDIKQLEANTPPHAIIGSTGGGIVAYFVKDRTIVNLDGLMNSYAYYQSMTTGKTPQFLDKMGLQYVYGSAYLITSSDPYIWIFKDRLTPVAGYKTVYGTQLYRYNP